MQLSKIQYKRKKKTLKDLDIYVKQVQLIRKEVQKVIFGKDEVINKILMTIIGGGHILIDNIPGVGKTTQIYLASILTFIRQNVIIRKNIEIKEDI